MFLALCAVSLDCRELRSRCHMSRNWHVPLWSVSGGRQKVEVEKLFRPRSQDPVRTALRNDR